MRIPRMAGGVLMLFALFHAAMGLNRAELPWLLAAVLLMVGGLALWLHRPWSRTVVFAAAAAAAAIGAISQARTALAAEADLATATVAWVLWSSVWLTAAYIGARYLPERTPATA